MCVCGCTGYRSSWYTAPDRRAGPDDTHTPRSLRALAEPGAPSSSGPAVHRSVCSITFCFSSSRIPMPRWRTPTSLGSLRWSLYRLENADRPAQTRISPPRTATDLARGDTPLCWVGENFQYNRCYYNSREQGWISQGSGASWTRPRALSGPPCRPASAARHKRCERTRATTAM